MDMKLAVVSDSHDNTDNLERVAAIANRERCAYLLHLGDITSPLSARHLKEFNGIIQAVYGNCDGELQGLTQAFNTIGGRIDRPPFRLEIEDKKFILMHEPLILDDLIASQELDYILYGHLHKVDRRRVGSTLILNPGESGGWMRRPSFFILDLHSGDTEKIDL